MNFTRCAWNPSSVKELASICSLVQHFQCSCSSLDFHCIRCVKRNSKYRHHTNPNPFSKCEHAAADIQTEMRHCVPPVMWPFHNDRKFTRFHRTIKLHTGNQKVSFFFFYIRSEKKKSMVNITITIETNCKLAKLTIGRMKMNFN